MQPLRAGAIYAQLCGDGQSASEAWLDGGHNPHAADAVARALADLEERDPKPVVLIAGLQATKDAAGYFAPFAGLVRQVIAAKAETANAASSQDIMAAAAGVGLPAIDGGGLAEAIAAARASVDGPARFVICGSLHLAGAVLAANAADAASA